MPDEPTQRPTVSEWVSDRESNRPVRCAVDAAGGMEIRANSLRSERLRPMLCRAMVHGLSGSEYYHASQDRELGDKVSAYLREVE